MEDNSRLRVLYLEDDADTRDMITLLLGRSNIDVSTVENSEQALGLVETRSFDAFLLDGMIPDGDSIRLCKILKARFNERPIIFYSGIAQTAEIERAKAAGASAYLIKPFLGDLAKVVRDWVRDSRDYQSASQST